MSALDELLDEYGRADTAPLGTLAELRQKLDAYRAEVIAEHRATFTMDDARGIARNHRRAVLQQAIGVAEQVTRAEGGDGLELAQAAQGGAARVTAALRRMVDETKEKDTREGESTPADLTIYRASHDSIVMGLYTTREAAREHCETLMHREQPNADLNWYTDPTEGYEGAPEDLFMVIAGGESDTGYVVTALTVASAYDEEADE